MAEKKGKKLQRSGRHPGNPSTTLKRKVKRFKKSCGKDYESFFKDKPTFVMKAAMPRIYNNGVTPKRKHPKRKSEDRHHFLILQ